MIKLFFTQRSTGVRIFKSDNFSFHVFTHQSTGMHVIIVYSEEKLWSVSEPLNKEEVCNKYNIAL